MPPIVIPVDGNITVNERAGSGLYGRVWEATQLGRRVAVKVIHPEMRKVAPALEHFLALARVGDHPNIVKVFTVARIKVPEEDKPAEAVVMEWLEGIRLDKLLCGKRLQASESIKICEGVLNGIEYMHKSGVAHGDLHAGNVIVTADGPKIIDIDCTKHNSLRTLTLHSREQRVESDIDYLRHLCWNVLSHSDLMLSAIASEEPAIRNAGQIEEIRLAIQNLASSRIEAPPTQVASIPRPTRRSASGEALLSPNVELSDLAKGLMRAVERDEYLTTRRVLQTHCRRAIDYITSDRFSVQAKADEQSFRQRVNDYDMSMRATSVSLATLAFAGGAKSTDWILESLEIVANCHFQLGARGGTTWWLDLELYPAAIALYAAGIGAIAGRNYEALRSILSNPITERFASKPEKLSSAVWYWRSVSNELWNQTYDTNKYTPVSSHLEVQLRDSLREYLVLDSSYIKAFDRFEYFGALNEFARTKGIALGSYSWRGGRRGERVWSEIESELDEQGDEWGPVNGGLYRSADEFRSIQKQFLELLSQSRAYNRMH